MRAVEALSLKCSKTGAKVKWERRARTHYRWKVSIFFHKKSPIWFEIDKSSLIGRRIYFLYALLQYSITCSDCKERVALRLRLIAEYVWTKARLENLALFGEKSFLIQHHYGRRLQIIPRIGDQVAEQTLVWTNSSQKISSESQSMYTYGNWECKCWPMPSWLAVVS